MVLQGIADAVQAYTGLSPAAAATILALMLATYLLVSSLFVAPASASSAPPEPPHQEKEEDKEKEKEEEATVPFVFPDPVEVGEVTLEQLRAYDGKDPAKQILIAIRGQVYDVSRGR
jgi:membrane-associated progesterone receptor component